MSSKVDGDLVVTGNISARTFTPPTGSVLNASVSPTAAIAATKIQKPRLTRLNQNGTATAETRAVYECRGVTATIQGMRVGSIGPCVGGATITVDLKKNGTTVLSGVVTLNNANTARVAVDAAVTSTALVVGDWLEVVVTATAGGGTIGTGLFVQVEIFEDQ
jgi:hypothetical protein